MLFPILFVTTSVIDCPEKAFLLNQRMPPEILISQKYKSNVENCQPVSIPPPNLSKLYERSTQNHINLLISVTNWAI